MTLKRVNVFTVLPGGIIPRPDGPNTANFQYDFDTNQILVVTKGSTKAATQPPSVDSAAFSEVSSGSTITIDSANGSVLNKTVNSPLTAVTIDLSSMQNGSQVNIQYAKTTSSSSTLTFPTGSLIRNQDGLEEPGLTTTITGTDQSIFLISAIKTPSYYLIAVSRFKL